MSTTTTHEFELIVPGKPVGQARPRAARVGDGVRVYSPESNIAGAAKIQAAWKEAGEPRLPDGPIWLYVLARFARPMHHWTTKGELSAAGRREPFPRIKPDLTNIEKLIEDALTDVGAWRSDAHVVRKWGNKDWCGLTNGPHVIVRAEVIR